MENETNLGSNQGDRPLLVDIIGGVRRVRDLRAVLPVSVTDRLGPGQQGIRRTLDMLRNLSRFYPQSSEGERLRRSDFEAYVSEDARTGRPAPDKLTQAMIEVALQEGIMERCVVQDLPLVEFIIRTPVQRQLGRIFSTRAYWR